MKDEFDNQVDLSGLKDHIVAFFMNLYRDPGFKRPKLDEVHFKNTSTSTRAWVERPFEEGKFTRWCGVSRMIGLQDLTVSLWPFLNVAGMW